MASNAQWVGTPKVKGSSESMRMALLTASLIGLQYVCQSRAPYIHALGLTQL
jgi:solute carrier family 45 protein 1/2/4